MRSYSLSCASIDVSAMRAASGFGNRYTPVEIAGKAIDRTSPASLRARERTLVGAREKRGLRLRRRRATPGRRRGSRSGRAACSRAFAPLRRSGNRETASTRSSAAGPAARWMAPSTPPPPRSAPFAALTIASTASVVMSAVTISIIEVRLPIRVMATYGHTSRLIPKNPATGPRTCVSSIRASRHDHRLHRVRRATRSRARPGREAGRVCARETERHHRRRRACASGRRRSSKATASAPA